MGPSLGCQHIIFRMPYPTATTPSWLEPFLIVICLIFNKLCHHWMTTAIALPDKQLLLKDINSHCPSRQQLLLKDNKNDWTTVKTTTTAALCIKHLCIIQLFFGFVMSSLDTTTASGHWLIAIFVVTPHYHNTTLCHLCNGPKYYNDIFSGIASSKNDTIKRARTHSLSSFLGSGMTP